MKTLKNLIPFLCCYLLTGLLLSFSQSKDLATQENKFVKQFATLSNSSGDSEKFEKDFRNFLSANPNSLDFSFNKLKNNSFYITTSTDSNFRHYSWDTGQGGSMHFFNEIYQWRVGGKVFVKQVQASEEGDSGEFSSKIYTINIQNKDYYLVVTNSIFSNRDARQSVIAFAINNDKLTPAPIFKTKTKLLSRIDVDFDFFSVVDRPERPLELITFNSKQDTLFIPVVDKDGKVTKRNILYVFNGTSLEFKCIK